MPIPIIKELAPIIEKKVLEKLKFDASLHGRELSGGAERVNITEGKGEKARSSLTEFVGKIRGDHGRK